MYWPESKKSSAKILRPKKGVANDSNKSNGSEAQVDDKLEQAVSMLVVLSKEMSHSQTLHQTQSSALLEYGLDLWQQSIGKTVSAKEANNVQLPLVRICRMIVAEVERIVLKLALNNSKRKLDTNAYKGHYFTTALVNSSELLTICDGEISTFVPVWRLVYQWASMPHLLQKLAVEAAKNEAKRSSILRLISNLCQALLDNLTNPAANACLKFDKSMKSYSWINLIEVLLLEPHPLTWGVVSK